MPSPWAHPRRDPRRERRAFRRHFRLGRLHDAQDVCSVLVVDASRTLARHLVVQLVQLCDEQRRRSRDLHPNRPLRSRELRPPSGCDRWSRPPGRGHGAPLACPDLAVARPCGRRRWPTPSGTIRSTGISTSSPATCAHAEPDARLCVEVKVGRAHRRFERGRVRELCWVEREIAVCCVGRHDRRLRLPVGRDLAHAGSLRRRSSESHLQVVSFAASTPGRLLPPPASARCR